METLRCDTQGFLNQFIYATQNSNPAQRGAYLEHGDGASSLERIHAEAAHTGDTRSPSVDEEINLHFVAFVEFCGNIWELDGRKAGPVNHGQVDKNHLLQNVAQVIKKEYIEKSDSLDFNIMALAAYE